MSCCWSGGSDGQAGFGEAAVYEVAAVLDVPQAAPDGLDEVFRVLKATLKSHPRRRRHQIPSTGLRSGAYGGRK